MILRSKSTEGFVGEQKNVLRGTGLEKVDKGRAEVLPVFCVSVNSKSKDLEPLLGFAANQGQDSTAIVQAGLITFVPTHRLYSITSQMWIAKIVKTTLPQTKHILQA